MTPSYDGWTGGPDTAQQGAEKAHRGPFSAQRDGRITTESYAAFTDRFGVHWMMNCAAKPEPPPHVEEDVHAAA